MDKHPHVLLVPFPSQGHITPLMKLANVIADHGVRVTFVNTEIMHSSINAGRANSRAPSRVRLVSVPDGLQAEDNRRDVKKFMRSLIRIMPGNLRSLIEKFNECDEKVSFVVVDITLGWLVKVVKKMGINCAGFSPAAPFAAAAAYSIPKLIEDGVLDDNGMATEGYESVRISEGSPVFNSKELPWTFPFDIETQKVIFEYASSTVEAVEHSDHVLCNAFEDPDFSASDLIPKLICIGPLPAASQSVSIWEEDTTCLTWLDSQVTNSVIYVAFGSIAILSQHQFNEIALGLELTGKPFLWVVRPDLMNGVKVRYPEGFLERVRTRGMIVEWAPQGLVLAHDSITCFVSHCGWNSTVEGLSMGIPFLCWPCFSDQFQNKKFICEIWRVGLGMEMDDTGIVSRLKVKEKVERLLADKGIRENALKFKQGAVESASIGGSSFEKLDWFIKKLKDMD